MTYGSVVVGTDGSATAELAVRHAGKVAADHGARLVIVTAYEPHGDELLESLGDRVPDDIRYTLTDKVQAEELASKGRVIATEEGAKRITAQAIAGSPADVLLEAAEDFGADVIVVGSRGLTKATSRLVLGSVASSISHHAPCDVLIVQTTN